MLWKLVLSISLTGAILMLACGKKPQVKDVSGSTQAKFTEGAVDLPPWFVNIPQDQEFHYERGEATGKHMEDAERAARTIVRGQIANWLTSKVEEGLGRQRDLVGENERLSVLSSDLVKSYTSETLVGVEASPGHLETRMTGDGKYHVYLLLRIPRERAVSSFDKLSAREKELKELIDMERLKQDVAQGLNDYKTDQLR